MPEAFRKRPSVVRACMDTPFDDGFDFSTPPPLSYAPLSTQKMFYYTIYICWAFFSPFWWLDRWEMVLGLLVGLFPGACVVALLLLISFFILQGLAFYKTQKVARRSENTDDCPSCGGGDPLVDQRIVAAVDR